MPTKRRQTRNPRSIPAAMRRSLALMIGPWRSFAMSLAVTTVLVVALVILWRLYGSDFLASNQYQVTAANLEITPLPSWIRCDPRPSVVDCISLKGPLSIMDDDAAGRVAEAFKLHPWVDRVIRVTKHHPARIRVELAYRRPACLVFCTIRGEREFCPVDARGVWLPGDDFVLHNVSEYPIVDGITSAPVSLPGMPWGDECVVGAAEIADAFGPTWHELKLHRIVPAGRVSSGPRAEYVYDLYTWRGRQIIWGCSPRATAPGEWPASEKISRLRQYAAAHGGLDGEVSREPIDVRRPVVSPPEPIAATQRTEDQRRRH